MLKGYGCYLLDDDGQIKHRDELAASAAGLALERPGTLSYPAAAVWDLGRLIDQLTGPAAL